MTPEPSGIADSEWICAMSVSRYRVSGNCTMIGDALNGIDQTWGAPSICDPFWTAP